MESDNSKQKDFDRASNSAEAKSQSGKSRSGEKARSEDELLNELENMNEKCDPQYFQSEIKRFGTGSLKQNPQEITQQEQDVSHKRLGSNQFRRKSSISSRKQPQKKVFLKRNMGTMEKVLWKRKLCRLATLLTCISLTIIILVTFYMLGMQSVYLKIDLQDKDIAINLSNCRIFLGPCAQRECKGSTVYLSFLRSVKNILTPTNYKKSSFGYHLDGSTLTFDVNHLDEQRGCNLYLDLVSGIRLNSLNITCNTSCTIINKEGSVVVGKLTIKAETLSMNMLHLYAQTLSIKANVGYVQLNELELGSVSGSSVTVYKGDILVQSSKNLRVEYVTACEHYCFASKAVSIILPATKSTLGSEMMSTLTYADFEEGRYRQQWTGLIDLCNSTLTCSGMTPTSGLKLSNIDGNIYVNILDSIPGNVNDSYQITKGSTYNGKVTLPIEASKKITKMSDLTTQSSLPNLIIRFVFGNGEAWSSHASHWVYVNHPLFSILKPWWLSFFTLGKLVENSNDITTYLSPGFCPYRHILSQSDHFQISLALEENLSLLRGVACFQKSSLEPLIPNITQLNDGFQRFAEFTQFSDEWVQVQVVDGYKDKYKAIYLTDVRGVFWIMCLTIILSTGLSLRLTFAVIGMLLKNFHDVRRSLYHQELYWSVQAKMASSKRKDTIHLEGDEDHVEKAHNQSVVKNFHFTLKKSYIDLPSTMVFVDHMIVQLWTRRSASISRFYNHAFEKVTYQELSDLDRRDAQTDKIPLKTLTSLYQQMCFILNYDEADLTCSENIGYLQDKGMMLTYGDAHRHYLIRLTMPANIDLSLNFIKQDKKATSLHLFLERFCEKTDFDEDMVPFEHFMERYGLFCKLNHLDPMLIDLIILKNKFGIESKKLLRELVERDYDQFYSRDTHTVSNCFERLLIKLQNQCCKKSYYTLKAERAKNINLFLAGKLTESDVGKREYKKIVETTILSRWWYIKDFFAIFLELIICVALSVPFISMFIFQEIEHSTYSLRSELINIYGFNTYSSDIWLVPLKVNRGHHLGHEKSDPPHRRHFVLDLLVLSLHHDDGQHHQAGVPPH